MADMLDSVGLKLEGRHHSGIDDARNIAKVCIKLVENGFSFNQAMILDST